MIGVGEIAPPVGCWGNQACERIEAVAAQSVGCWGWRLSEEEAEDAQSVECWGRLGMRGGLQNLHNQ